jgi:hypothetical protein
MIPKDKHRMMSQLECKDFRPAVTTQVKVQTNQGAFELDMMEATGLDRGNRPAEFRDPFPLMFRGPLKPTLAAGTCRVELEKLGRLMRHPGPVRSPDRRHTYCEADWT